MIYNRRLNLLFVHIQKTAGTSIVQVLMAEHGSQFIRPAHMRLEDVRRLWRRPRIVAVVRNPWERMVSWYRMMLRNPNHNDFSAYLLTPEEGGSRPVSFSSFLRRTAVITETSHAEGAHQHSWRLGRKWNRPYLKSLAWNQVDYLTVHGRFAADHVVRFDDLDAQWTRLGETFKPGEGWSLPLPRLNAAPDGEPGDWRGYYRDERDIDFVRELHARDVARFGFRFDA